jgi:hypothetical protein
MALDIVLFWPALLYERPVVMVSAAAWFVSQKRTGPASVTSYAGISSGASGLTTNPPAVINQDPVQLFAQLSGEIAKFASSKDELKKVVYLLRDRFMQGQNQMGSSTC